MVYADSDHNELIALIHPNKNKVEEFAEKKGIHVHLIRMFEIPIFSPFFHRLMIGQRCAKMPLWRRLSLMIFAVLLRAITFVASRRSPMSSFTLMSGLPRITGSPLRWSSGALISKSSRKMLSRALMQSSMVNRLQLTILVAHVFIRQSSVLWRESDNPDWAMNYRWRISLRICLNKGMLIHSKS